MDPDQEAAEMRAYRIRSQLETIKYLMAVLVVGVLAACVLLWMIWDKLPD